MSELSEESKEPSREAEGGEARIGGGGGGIGERNCRDDDGDSARKDAGDAGFDPEPSILVNLESACSFLSLAADSELAGRLVVIVLRAVRLLVPTRTRGYGTSYRYGLIQWTYARR